MTEDNFFDKYRVPTSMQGDSACLLKCNGDEVRLDLAFNERITKETVSNLVGEKYSKATDEHNLMVYRNNLSKTKENFNTEASRIMNFNIYGDAIYAPSELFNI